jgi:hypothetical protein
MTLGGDRTGPEVLSGRPGGRHRKTHGVQAVTHRAPVGDDTELPCCGKPVSAVQEPDRITSDPSEVTCHG